MIPAPMMFTPRPLAASMSRMASGICACARFPKELKCEKTSGVPPFSAISIASFTEFRKPIPLYDTPMSRSCVS